MFFLSGRIGDAGAGGGRRRGRVPVAGGRRQRVNLVADGTERRNLNWATRPRSAPSADQVPGGARFPRFAAAMDAAREAKAPQLDLYTATPPEPAADNATSWRTPGGPMVRWVGIGSCVLLFGLLTATMLSQPIGAAIERLIAAGGEDQAEPAAAPPAAVAPAAVAPATLEPAAGLHEPPPTRSLPVLVNGATRVPADRATRAPKERVTRVTVLERDDRPLAALPVPSFKPPAASQ
jgi:hypothetical protein